MKYTCRLYRWLWAVHNSTSNSHIRTLPMVLREPVYDPRLGALFDVFLQLYCLHILLLLAFPNCRQGACVRFAIPRTVNIVHTNSRKPDSVAIRYRQSEMGWHNNNCLCLLRSPNNPHHLFLCSVSRMMSWSLHYGHCSYYTSPCGIRRILWRCVEARMPLKKLENRFLTNEMFLMRMHWTCERWLPTNGQRRHTLEKSDHNVEWRFAKAIVCQQRELTSLAEQYASSSSSIAHVTELRCNCMVVATWCCLANKEKKLRSPF